MNKTILVICLGLLLVSCTPKDPVLGDTHTHQDFKMFILGEELNFSRPQFMSDLNGSQKSPFVHLHDDDGEIIHIHMSTVTLGEFFRSIGIQLTDECIKLGDKKSYCEDETNSVKVYVNGKVKQHASSYIPTDLDQILISYGTQDPEEIATQWARVTDRACIQSEKCPERGLPSPESSCLSSTDCVGFGDSTDGHDHEH